MQRSIAISLSMFCVVNGRFEKILFDKKSRVGEKQIVVPSENDIFEISKDLDLRLDSKFLV